jgi:hypothetical protein
MALRSNIILKKISKLNSGPSLADTSKQLEASSGLVNQRANVQNISQNIQNTQKMLKEAPTNVNLQSRRLGGPVTSYALDRLTTQAQAPITQQLSELSQSKAVADQGIEGTQQDIDRQLRLMQQDRATRQETLQGRLNVVLGREQQAAQEQARLREIYAGQAMQREQLRIQQEAERRKNQLLKKLAEQANFKSNISGIINTGTSNGQKAGVVKSASSRNSVVDFLQNNALGQFATTVGGAGQAIVGGDRKISPEEQKARAATAIRMDLGDKSQQAIANFLTANPQFRNQGIKSTADILALQRAGVPINPFDSGGQAFSTSSGFANT